MVYRVDRADSCGVRRRPACPSPSPCGSHGPGTNVSRTASVSESDETVRMICRWNFETFFETVFVTRAESRGLRARVDTHRDKGQAGGCAGRPPLAVRLRGGGATLHVPKRPAAQSPRHGGARSRSFTHPLPLEFQTTHSHTFTRTNARRKQMSVGKVSLPCERAHAATPSASQHVSKHPTGRHGRWYPSSSGRGPSASPASEAMCDNAAQLPSRRARSSTGWPTFVVRAAQALAARPASSDTARLVGQKSAIENVHA